MNPFARWLGSDLEVAVVGLGRSGVAAARLLHRHGVSVYASDAAPDLGNRSDLNELRERGVVVEVGGHDLPRIGRATAVVLSPGVPPTSEAVIAASEGQGEIVAEVDVGFEALPASCRTVCITGTNGKSTTTALTAHLLIEGGIDAMAVGNIGIPLSDVAARESPPSWLVVELSSFQLHDCSHHQPAVGIVTNLAPDHLDRYPCVEAYYADKERLFLNATPNSIWVRDQDDEVVSSMMAAVPGRHLSISLSAEADAWYDRRRQVLRLGTDVSLTRGDVPLLGDHNVANVLMALLAAREAGVSAESLQRGIGSFRPLAHRLEPLRTHRDVVWINDSKATNLSSTAVAVVAMDRPFLLLLGGRHKGEPYARLGSLLKGRCRGVLAYGEAEEQILRDLAGLVPTEGGFETFEEVVTRAATLARPGEGVLLSPACSSYDMFPNYQARGDRFRTLVEAL